MAWAGTGALFAFNGGVASSIGLDSAIAAPLRSSAAAKRFTFVQVSDSHIGFNKPPNADARATFREAIAKIKALPVQPDFIVHTGDVSQLSKAEIKGTAVNLNFDMVGSPNSVNFVYDGDGDALGVSGPNGSGVVEDVFTDYFDSQDIPWEPTDFDGRSDYFGFIEAGIPAGGLFTGAEGIKSAEQAAIFGGTAGVAYDPCYHAACDTLGNINDETLDLMSDAVAHSTLVFAETTSAVNGTGKGKAVGQFKPNFKGHQAIR